MGKGTAARGKMGNKVTHIQCRRCGNKAFHVRKKKCSSCGYGQSAKVRSHNW